jgi:hypothetical protein
VQAVGEGEPLPLGAGESVGEVRAVAPGLLVLELAREEHRHPDLVDERGRVEGVRDAGAVVAVVADLRDQVRGGGVQRLVRLAHLIAPLNPLVRPGLTLGRRRGLRVVHAILGPLDGEAGVEEAARIERGGGVVDHRQRGDRGQVRRRRRSDEELADPAV